MVVGNLIAMAVVLILVIVGAWIGLDHYTLHGQGIEVPDVSGMGVKDAVFALQKRGLRVRINGCGQIVKQDIAPGSVAVKGKQITLTASPK